MGKITLFNKPLPCHQCSAGMDQMIACPFPPAAAKAAPQRPPTSACEELDGNPHHQVIRSHAVAPSKAQIRRSGVTTTTPASINPEEIVLATAVPQKIGHRGEKYGLQRPQHLGRHHGGDGIGRVVKAIDVLEDQRDDEYREDQGEAHSAGRIGGLGG